MTRPGQSSPKALVSSRSLVALDHAARAIGLHVDISKLAPDFDPADGSRNFPVEQQFAYCQALYRHPRETLGLELATHLPLESTGLWGFLLRSSATFGEMLQRARRYQRIVNVYEEFELKAQGENIAMICHHPNPSPFGAREQVVITLLGHWIAWGRQLSGHPMPAISASFQWAGPKDPTPFERFFKGPVHFRRSKDMIVFPKAYLDLPYRDGTPELGKTFETYAAALTSQLMGTSDFTGKVESEIQGALLTGNATESQVAAALGLTARTLHRRLSSLGKNFRELKYAVIMNRAKELLHVAETPLAEVSYLLGFSEPSSFHRAFRRWTGKTPVQWRKNHREGRSAGVGSLNR